MQILLSNDDGYQAPGLRALYQAVSAIADTVVVAPDRDRSGASNSLTLEQPIRAREGENGFIRVEGTPTDCVHLAITGLLEAEPDLRVVDRQSQEIDLVCAWAVYRAPVTSAARSAASICNASSQEKPNRTWPA